MAKHIVYSTNPNYVQEEEEGDMSSIGPESQKLRVRLETKQRAGKRATVVLGFQGTAEELETLAKTLKTKLGTGGSAKDGEIIIQGDYVMKVKDLLKTLGYRDTK